jgi:curved DNA-binding protein CbpA
MGQGYPLKNRRNYCRILHIQQDAPLEVIKASYRTLMGKLGCHPDMGGAHVDASLVNEAYEILCNPRKRVEYDFLLSLKQNNRRKKQPGKERTSAAGEKQSRPVPDVHTEARSLAASEQNAHRHCPICGEAGCRKRHEKSGRIEHRKLNRVKREGRVSYTLANSLNPYEGEIIDLSPKGMKFLSKKELDPMTRIEVQCAFFSGAARVVNSEVVRRAKSLMYMIHLNFLKVEFERPSGTFLSVKG